MANKPSNAPKDILKKIKLALQSQFLHSKGISNEILLKKEFVKFLTNHPEKKYQNPEIYARDVLNGIKSFSTNFFKALIFITKIPEKEWMNDLYHFGACVGFSQDQVDNILTKTAHDVFDDLCLKEHAKHFDDKNKSKYSSSGIIDFYFLREKLFYGLSIDLPCDVKVTGILFPSALLSNCFLLEKNKYISNNPNSSISWDDPLKKWLYNGLMDWSPSFNFCFDFQNFEKNKKKSFFVCQLGRKDEADSIPVIIPQNKALILIENIENTWGGVEVEIHGTLKKFNDVNNLNYFREVESNLVTNLLDYCLWLDPENKNHKIRIKDDKTDIYSAYLWKCLVPKNKISDDKPPQIKDVYFLWEHVNLAEKSTFDFGLETLNIKEEIISRSEGELLVVQKSHHLMPGIPTWTLDDIYGIFTGHAGIDI